MSVSVASRHDSVVSTPLPAPSPVVSPRWSRVMIAMLRRLSTSSGAQPCAYCEPSVAQDEHHNAAFLDTLARDKPYLYSVTVHH